MFSSSSTYPFPAQTGDTPLPLCTFVTGPRDAGKTRHILQRLRLLATPAHPPEETVAVLLAEEGRTRAETLVAAFPGLLLRRLFLPCQCCPELARLSATLSALREAHPQLAYVFIEAPATAALPFVAEFDAALGWPRCLVTCLSTAWGKARRLDMLLPLQLALLEKADVVIEPAPASEKPPASSERGGLDPLSPTTAPFDLPSP